MSTSPAPSVVSDITVAYMQPSEIIVNQALYHRHEPLASALLMMSAITIERDPTIMKAHAVSLIMHIIETCNLGEHVSFQVNGHI